MRYDLISEKMDSDGGTKKFVARVNEAIQDGWEPIGGPFPEINNPTHGVMVKRFYQTMVKHDRPQPNYGATGAGSVLHNDSTPINPAIVEPEKAKTAEIKPPKK